MVFSKRPFSNSLDAHNCENTLGVECETSAKLKNPDLQLSISLLLTCWRPNFFSVYRNSNHFRKILKIDPETGCGCLKRSNEIGLVKDMDNSKLVWHVHTGKKKLLNGPLSDENDEEKVGNSVTFVYEGRLKTKWLLCRGHCSRKLIEWGG